MLRNSRQKGEVDIEVQKQLNERVAEIATLRRLGKNIEEMLVEKKDSVAEEIKNNAVQIEIFKTNIKKRKQKLNLDSSFASEQANSFDENLLEN